MALDCSTRVLDDVVGSVLDATTGLTATSLLPLLDHHASLIGTSAGSVLFCANSRDSATALAPVSEATLHCGPVHAMALSSQHLIATAGHDAVSCVFPVHALFQEGGLARCRRLVGHTVPIAALRFLADGATLITLGVDGCVRVVDAVRGDVLAVLSAGFAATCMACSLDETVLYVGGRSLAAMDLQYALRPTSLHSAAAAEMWSGGTVTARPKAAGVRLYQWASPASAAGAGEEASPSASGAFVERTPAEVMLRQLCVERHDNTLTAYFAKVPSGGAAPLVCCGVARWAPAGGRKASHTSWEPTAASKPARRGSAAVSVRCNTKTSARASVKQHATPSASSANAAAALWHGRWYASPFELTGDATALGACWGATAVPSTLQLDDVLASPSATAASPLCTRGEELARAEVRCDELQRECDALVFQIRALRAQRNSTASAAS